MRFYPPTHPSRHRMVGLLSVWLLSCWAASVSELRADDRWTRVPAEAVLVVEMNHPARGLQSEYLARLWETASQTSELSRKLADEESDRWRHAARFLEQSLKTDWKNALDRLTAGGVVLAVVPTAPTSPPDVLLIVEADAAETLRSFVTTIHTELARRDVTATESQVHRGMTYYRTGEAFYAQTDKTLVASNSRRLLVESLDRAVSPAVEEKRRIPVPQRSDRSQPSEPLAAVRGFVSLEWLRGVPEIATALRVPATEPAGQLLFGGYLDLFRRGTVAELEVALDQEGVELCCRIDAGSAGRAAEWKGFFADGVSSRAWPALNPPGTVYTASWYRDYQQLWEARRHWLTPGVIAELEAENERQRKAGMRFGVVDLVEEMGPHHRFVVARSADDNSREGNWPQAAFTIDLRDPMTFQKRFVEPLISMLRVIAVSVGGDIELSMSDGVTAMTLGFTATPESVLPESVVRAISPTLLTGHGYLLLATSREFAEGVFAEVDRRPAGLEDASAATTEQQRLSLMAIADFFTQFRQELERNVARDKQLGPAEAKREVDLFLTLLRQLDSISSRSQLRESGFEYRIRLGGGMGTGEQHSR
ncbi:MAG: hypothetical protein NT069_12375 [Planctomycetota bacterium]|nr:hypothetical protein [Planctomycetota bacterium]